MLFGLLKNVKPYLFKTGRGIAIDAQNEYSGAHKRRREQKDIQVEFWNGA